MLTYLDQEVKELALDLGITIMAAKSTLDQEKVAIHLLNPDHSELLDAIEQAEKDNFKLIVVHNKTTWPKS